MLIRFAFLLVLPLASYCQDDSFDINPEELSEGYIVGGENANIQDYPYQASLLVDSSHICGGSIVARRYIITAAHCTNSYRNSISRLRVRIGSSFQGTGGETISISRVIQHPSYSSASLDYDIAVLVLSRSIVYSSTKKSIPISTWLPSAGTMATVTGWGRTSTNGPSAYQLQKVNIPIVSQSRCSMLNGGYLTSRMICAGYTGQEKGTCFGDSGGPMVANGKLLGVVSWIRGGCGSTIYPSVYASVPALRSFITSNVVFD